jgi:flavin-dependent thymidylate synthase
MRVILAGYNVDSAVLDELRKSAAPRSDVTPETLSASYARISRDPRPADELRAAARAEVERARRSNQTIIFKMGHHSVAEHAVFNFDVIGVSRLAIEEIEHFRLVSFTEKSQRYITLGDDFVIPEEIRRAGREGLFTGTVKAQNALYHSLYARLRPYVFEANREAAADPRNHTVLDGWAKEDARYIVSLATEGQLGMTTNARNLELLVRRFAAKENEEIRELNRRLLALAREVAPSLLLFTEAGEFDALAYGDIARTFGGMAAASSAAQESSPKDPPTGRHGVSLVAATPGGDVKILAALVHTAAGLPFAACADRVAKATPAARRSLAKEALRRMEFYDFPLREFEYAGLTFELVLSASCFAQIKRHRMATLTAQRYDPALGAETPPSVLAIGAGREFREMIARTDEAHAALAKDVGAVADYVLTNAHRRRVLLDVNVRELYHISRLREDATAQWEIRRAAVEMSRLAKREMPLACLLVGGKDAYPELYKRIFGRAPRAVPPALFR